MQHAATPYAPGLADAVGEIAQLRELLELVSSIAGRASALPADGAMDDAAKVSAAYAAACPLDQRRFDRLCAETAGWAAAGVETLLALKEKDRPCGPAAATLAGALERSLSRLAATVGA